MNINFMFNDKIIEFAKFILMVKKTIKLNALFYGKNIQIMQYLCKFNPVKLNLGKINSKVNFSFINKFFKEIQVA